MEVTVNLSDQIYQSFKQLAEKTNRRIDEVIAEKIQTGYSVENTNNEEVMASLTDSEVLELANLKLSDQQDKRMSFLLENQREGQITTSEKIELEGTLSNGNLTQSPGLFGGDKTRFDRKSG